MTASIFKYTGFIFCFIIVFCNSAKAQSKLLIKHDLLNNKTAYYTVSAAGDTLLSVKPRIRKSTAIVLTINNVNTFYYVGAVTLQKRISEEANNQGVYNPFNLLARSFGGTYAAALPSLELKTTRANATTEIQYKAVQLFDAFNSIYEAIQKEDALYRKLKLHEAELTKIKYSINKTDAQVKEAAGDYMQQYLLQLYKGWQQKQVPVYWNDITMKMHKDSIAALYRNLMAVKAEIPADTRVGGESFSVRYAKAAFYYSELQQLFDTEYKNNNAFTNEYRLLYNLFEEIMNASFVYEFKASADAQTAGIKLALSPNVVTGSKDTTFRYFQLNRNSFGIRMRNSVGTGFSFFADQKNYFVQQDSTIGSSKADQFNPVFASFLHFYRGSDAPVKVGGVLGIGIPLSNEKNVQFMTGLTLILGNNDNFFLSAGVAGAKINRLDKGLKPGAKVANRDVALPLKSFYDLGGFISISFNLNMLNGKK